jgi:hypothetical protein
MISSSLGKSIDMVLVSLYLSPITKLEEGGREVRYLSGGRKDSTPKTHKDSQGLNFGPGESKVQMEGLCKSPSLFLRG